MSEIKKTIRKYKYDTNLRSMSLYWKTWMSKYYVPRHASVNNKHFLITRLSDISFYNSTQDKNIKNQRTKCSHLPYIHLLWTFLSLIQDWNTSFDES